MRMGGLLNPGGPASEAKRLQDAGVAWGRGRHGTLILSQGHLSLFQTFLQRAVCGNRAHVPSPYRSSFLPPWHLWDISLARALIYSIAAAFLWALLLCLLQFFLLIAFSQHLVTFLKHNLACHSAVHNSQVTSHCFCPSNVGLSLSPAPFSVLIQATCSSSFSHLWIFAEVDVSLWNCFRHFLRGQRLILQGLIHHFFWTSWPQLSWSFFPSSFVVWWVLFDCLSMSPQGECSWMPTLDLIQHSVASTGPGRLGIDCLLTEQMTVFSPLLF